MLRYTAAAVAMLGYDVFLKMDEEVGTLFTTRKGF